MHTYMYTKHYINKLYYMILLFIKFLHMFVLPDVVSASIVCVTFMVVTLSFTLVSTECTEILNMILS